MRVTSTFILKTIIVFLAICLVYFVLKNFDVNEENYREYVDYYLQRINLEENIHYYILGIILLSSCAIPRQPLSLIGGFIYGPVIGTILTTIATTIACVIVFNFSKFIARDFVQRKFTKQIAFIEAILTVNTFMMTIVLRLMPMGAGITTNLIAGTAKIDSRKFFLGTFIGYIPQNFIFSLLASDYDFFTCLIISIVVYIFSCILGYWLYKKHFSTNQNLIKNFLTR